jgi:hypothetical protein
LRAKYSATCNWSLGGFLDSSLEKIQTRLPLAPQSYEVTDLQVPFEHLFFSHSLSRMKKSEITGAEIQR